MVATKSYFDKEFGSRKEIIEAKNIGDHQLTGGFFGLVHVKLKEHFQLFEHCLKETSPFVVAELCPKTQDIISNDIINIGDDRIGLVRCDIFKGLFGRYKHTKFTTGPNKIIIHRTPMFCYGHLDFCKTAMGLIEDGLTQNLRHLATWWNLKDNFKLDITVSKRGDLGLRTTKLLTEDMIPCIFENSGWEMIDLDIDDYCDTSAMRCAAYEFRRNRSWKDGHNYYEFINGERIIMKG